MAINGGTANVNILKSPRSSSLANYGYSQSDHQVLVSCNSPMIYQVQWGQTINRITNLMPEVDYIANDVVNVLFDVYIGNDFENSFNEATGNMFYAGTLRKSRDLPYIANEGIRPLYDSGNALVNYHTFTIDIAPVVKNFLSYTLTPMMKGSPSHTYAMSGDYTTNDFFDFTSIDGTSRFVDVQCRFEVYEQNPSDSKRLMVSVGDYKNTATVSVINAAIQHTDKIGLNNNLITCSAATTSKQFLTRAPFTNFAGKGISGYKSVRMDDEAEFLSWFQYTFANDGSDNYDMTDYYLRIETSDGNTANLRDFQETLGNDSSPTAAWWVGNTSFTDATVRKVLSQNISPAYVNSHTASTITSATEWYHARLICSGATLGSGQTVSEARYYTIDREDVKPAYDFVRFHWLNRMGGIDSYTAKRNISETITSDKVFFERKSPNPLYSQQWDGTTFTPAKDPMGSDLYKPSVTTFSIEATRKKSVYTEPLNIPEAGWIEEILTSPNVWIELDTEAGEWANERNEKHPSTRDYFPVTINNSEFVTVNQEEGLVKLNIEYTMSHSINTQSN
tara:strand:+ start:278 stop:1966 length:1689 start_codon:yes stop_codon:yes gene_type:complete